MGIVWSSVRGICNPFVQQCSVGAKRRHEVEADTYSCEKDALPLKKRRTLPIEESKALYPAQREVQGPVGSKVQNSQIFDASRDGKVHRFKVRCPALYWSNKKDIARFLGRIHDFPPYCSLQKISTWDHFFITFPNAHASEAGAKALGNVVCKGDTWTAFKVSEFSAKRSRINRTLENSRKEQDCASLAGCKTAADVTAPWREINYDEQVQRKRDMMHSALSQVTEEMLRQKFPVGTVPWLDSLRRDAKAPSYDSTPVCCPLVRFVQADKGSEGGRDFYRNKNEFTVGYSPANCGMGHTYHVREPTVGFSLGLVRDGEVRVSPVTEDCMTTSVVSRLLAKALTPIVQSSGLEPYDKTTHHGYWRQFMCRQSERTKTLLVIPMVCTTSSQPCSEVDNFAPWTDLECREGVKRAISEALENDSYKWGLYWQVNNHVSAPASDVAVEWVCGEKDLFENLLGLTFRVNPVSFFQVNSVMAERLYRTIAELGGVNGDSILLDICCGTGTIGLSLAKLVHRVIGVEMSEAAVLDARHNAARNSIKNSLYIVGKVEDKIREVLSFVKPGRECVAVLDPPRAGVHNSVRLQVITALRSAKVVRRIVYVACEPMNLFRNAVALCRPRSKTYHGAPFTPKRSVAVDLFPHTPCCELVVQFER